MTKDEKKGSFILYDIHYQTIENLGLSREEKGDLFDAIFQYHMNGTTEVELSTLAFAAFQFIKTQIDRDTARYKEVCERRRMNGAKGGAPKGNTNAKKADGEPTVKSEEDNEHGDETLKTENNQNKQMVVFQPKQPKSTKTTCNENENENDYGVTNVTYIKEYKEETSSSMSFDGANDALHPSEKEESVKVAMVKKECDIDFNKLAEYFNSKLPSNGMPQVRRITPKRKAAILAREKEHGKNAIIQVIDNATESSFLNGDNNRGFVASFDWIFRPNNFPKVLEGNYARRTTNGQFGNGALGRINDAMTLAESLLNQ
jgi:hypothetical protein